MPIAPAFLFPGFKNRLRAGLAALLVSVLPFSQPAAAPAPLPTASGGAVTCTPADDRGIERCVAGLDAGRMAQLLQEQQGSEWCWAAAIAMVFAGHGYEVAQDAVVKENFGDTLDRAAQVGELTRLLNRSWQDRSGRGFVVHAEPVPLGSDMRRSTRLVLDAIGRGHPMILGARQHAVVLAQVEFERFTREDAIRIVGGTVLDPARGEGVRKLRAHELKPLYLTTVHLAADDDAVPPRPFIDDRAPAARATLAGDRSGR